MVTNLRTLQIKQIKLYFPLFATFRYQTLRNSTDFTMFFVST